MTQRFDRRQALTGLGAAGIGALISACGADRPPRTTTTPPSAELLDEAGTCRLTAEQAEGPFYLDAEAIRSDITEGREGARLRLAFRVRDAEGCRPLRDAVVDVWHCDAAGVYSGFDAGEGERFLRGAQVTNADGVVQFTTIYPGGYSGRTVHIHVKVHLDGRTALTTQVYFPDAITDRVHADPPYAGARDQGNDDDALFDPSLLLTLREEAGGWRGAIGFDVARA